MNEEHEAPKAEVVKFDPMDVVCTSGCTTVYETDGSHEYIG